MKSRLYYRLVYPIAPIAVLMVGIGLTGCGNHSTDPPTAEPASDVDRSGLSTEAPGGSGNMPTGGSGTR